MSVDAGFPNLKQGVRLMTEGSAAQSIQVTAVVDAIGVGGSVDLGIVDAKLAVHLQPGVVVTLEYYREGIVYKLKAQVAETLSPSSGLRAFPRIRLAPPIEVKKIQRRRFPRALVALDVAFVKLALPAGADIKGFEATPAFAAATQDLSVNAATAVTETLSGSGLRMRTTAPTTKGEFVVLRLELPEGPVEMLGEVVWQGTSKPRESPGMSVGIAFKNPAGHAAQAVLQFVGGQKYLH